jgi:hypothetical protein
MFTSTFLYKRQILSLVASASFAQCGDERACVLRRGATTCSLLIKFGPDVIFIAYDVGSQARNDVIKRSSLGFRTFIFP